MGSENESACQVVPGLRSPAKRIVKYSDVPGLKSPARRVVRNMENQNLLNTSTANARSGLFSPERQPRNIQRPLQPVNLNVERNPVEAKIKSESSSPEFPSKSQSHSPLRRRAAGRFMTPERSKAQISQRDGHEMLSDSSAIAQTPCRFYTPQSKNASAQPPLSCLSTTRKGIMKDTQGEVTSPTRLKSPKKKVTFNPLEDCTCVIRIQSSSKPGMAESIERKAVRLGSKISQEVNDSVTHLIFRQSQEQLAKKAKSQGIICVSPRWIIECEEKMRRVDEQPYIIE